MSELQDKLRGLRSWLMEVQSEDPSVLRRAQTFIPLTASLLVVSTLSSMVMMLFMSDGPLRQIQLMILVAAATSNLAAIAMARAGRMNWAGATSGCVTIVAFTVAALMENQLILAMGWFYGVGVLLASYAMQPKLLFGVWAFALACLTFAFRILGTPPYGHQELWEPTMGSLLLFITVSSYLHARSTEQIFQQQLDGARQLEVARQEAEQASHAKSAFLANMSHELRTPLNAIIGYSEMLMEEAEDSGEDAMREDLGRIHGAGNHLLSLINDILDLSKIEAGRMELFVEAFDVSELIEQVKQTLGPVVARNQNKLIVRVDRSCGRIASDRTKLRQVLLNLLSNAAKFTHQGTITLTARRVTRGKLRVLEICVGDTGIGMTPEQLSRVFNEFEQADKSTTKEYGGTGLGLALCRRLAHLLEGDIEATSTPHVGSTFTCFVAVEHSETTPEAAAALYEETSQPVDDDLAERPAHAPQATVLLIDDDPDSHALLTRTLGREGFRVLSAKSGDAGLEIIRHGERIDVILLDILMPEENGWQILHKLKHDEHTSHIPVILVSVVDEQQRGLALGASDYVMKPIERARLMGAIERLTQAAPRRDGQSVEVLIVEDDEDTRELLRRMLSTELWKVHEAPNGVQALELLELVQPNIILLDLMMPRMDGFEVLRRLRQDERWRHIPVVIVTAKTLSSDERDFLRRGAVDVLRKGELDQARLVAQARQAVGLSAA